MTSIDVSTIHEGDHVVAEYRGHRFEGPAWKPPLGYLMVGATMLDARDVTVIEVRKQLPTEPNAMIADVVTRGGDKFPVARRTVVLTPDWIAYSSTGRAVNLSDDDIVSFVRLVREV